MSLLAACELGDPRSSSTWLFINSKYLNGSGIICGGSACSNNNSSRAPDSCKAPLLRVFKCMNMRVGCTDRR